MTRWRLRRSVFFVIVIYSGSIVAGAGLKFWADESVYNTFTDLIPLIIAAPAAWLGYCFSLRLALLQHLRTLWHQIVSAVQDSIQYTHLNSPTQEQFGDVLRNLSISIDELRGAFKNVGECDSNRGLYPYENLKSICDEISTLGFGPKLDPISTKRAREKIIENWKAVQAPFLHEFERTEPSIPSSPFLPRK